MNEELNILTNLSRRPPPAVRSLARTDDLKEYIKVLEGLDPADLNIADIEEPLFDSALAIATPDCFWFLFPGIVRAFSDSPPALAGFLEATLSGDRIGNLSPPERTEVELLVEALQTFSLLGYQRRELRRLRNRLRGGNETT